MLPPLQQCEECCEHARGALCGLKLSALQHTRSHPDSATCSSNLGGLWLYSSALGSCHNLLKCRSQTIVAPRRARPAGLATAATTRCLLANGARQCILHLTDIHCDYVVGECKPWSSWLGLFTQQHALRLMSTSLQQRLTLSAWRHFLDGSGRGKPLFPPQTGFHT